MKTDSFQRKTICHFLKQILWRCSASKYSQSLNEPAWPNLTMAIVSQWFMSRPSVILLKKRTGKLSTMDPHILETAVGSSFKFPREIAKALSCRPTQKWNWRHNTYVIFRSNYYVCLWMQNVLTFWDPHWGCATH